MCPPGVGESSTTTIGTSGGTASLLGQQGKASGVAFSIDIPPTALAADTVIEITETATPPPADFIDWSPVWQLAPAGTPFATPARLTVPWSNHDGVIDPMMAIYVSDDGVSWTRVADDYMNAGFNQGSLIRLPQYILNGYPKTAAQLGCP